MIAFETSSSTTAFGRTGMSRFCQSAEAIQANPHSGCLSLRISAWRGQVRGRGGRISGAPARREAQNREVTDELEHTPQRPSDAPRARRTSGTGAQHALGVISRPTRRAEPASAGSSRPAANRERSARAAEPLRDPSRSRVRRARRPYRLKMTDGVVVALDLTVYLGRKPSVPRIAERSPRAPGDRAVADKQVSAHPPRTPPDRRRRRRDRHALDERHRPSSCPARSRARCCAASPPSSRPAPLIDLGDGNVLEVLSPERWIADGTGVTRRR